ncbi:MAG TPA: hypothetical protein PKL78_05005 [Anaerolineales bacterium]|nr:hypothetical protein [Anaerolineales bacterium]HNO30310.1 hypothetical protein [Anaerolineales bacterium]
MLILNAEEVRKTLPMKETIEAMKSAYASLSDGKADVPLRTRLPISNHDALGIFMPAYVSTKDADALALKVVNIYPNNPARGLPYILASVFAFDAATGGLAAVLEGGTLTAIRTGAGSGAAIDMLARKDSRTVAVFGAGVQGRTQLEAACSVRRVETAWVFDSDPARAEAFVRDMAGKGPVPSDLRIASSSKEAVQNADIICTATTSTYPVFADADLKAGTHISAIGAYTPEMVEVPEETIVRAKVFVDSRSAVLAEAGDLIQPIQKGLITEAHVQAELGEILLRRKSGRQNDSDITFFKSVGVAVQDAMAAQLALKNAKEQGLGQNIPF